LTANEEEETREEIGAQGTETHLDAVARFLDAHATFSGLEVIDVPTRSYCS
jgi:hypothetical protein